MVSQVFLVSFLLFIPGSIFADIVDFHLLGAIPDDVSGILIVMNGGWVNSDSMKFGTTMNQPMDQKLI